MPLRNCWCLMVALVALGYASTSINASERVNVIFADGVTPLEQTAVVIHFGGIQLRSRPHSLTVAASAPTIAALATAAGVAQVEPDYVVTTGLHPLAAGNVQALETATATEGYPFGVYRIGATQTKALNTGQDVVIAIVDTGINLTHPDLVANIAGEHNVINSTKTAEDDNGHGSHCAGIAAAQQNGAGIIGVAPDAKLLAVKVLDRRGSGYSSDVADGITWAADHGAQVISMSLGSSASSSLIQNAVEYAAGLDIVIVCAAGNDGNAAPGTSNVNYPAKYPECIAISAWTDLDGTPAADGEISPWGDLDESLASFSCTGSEVELTAPGVNIYSCYKAGGYATMSGTSMATPHAAGVAALNIKAGKPDIRAAMAARAEHVAGTVEEVGAGLIRASAPPVPTLILAEPIENLTYYNNLTVALAATATDAEDGDLTASIAWTSDVAGALGSGGSLDVPLALGDHTITASVTNSNGVTSTAVRHIHVTVPPPTPAIVQSVDLQLLNGGQTLQVKSTIVDGDGNPLAGLTAVCYIYCNGIFWKQRVGTTLADGTVTFLQAGPPAGTLQAKVAALSGPNVLWDGTSPVGSVVRTASITAVVQSVAVSLVSGNLQVKPTIVNGSAAPLGGASVTVNMYADGVFWRQRVGTTLADGTVTFLQASPPVGTLTAKVVVLTGPDMTWNGSSPVGSLINNASTTAVVQAVNVSLVGVNQDLQVIPKIVDGSNNPLAGLSVLCYIYVDGVFWRQRTGTTLADGTVTFLQAGPPAGTLQAKVAAVSGTNIVWNGTSPVGSVVKTASIMAVVQAVTATLVNGGADLRVDVDIVDGGAAQLPGVTVTCNMYVNGVYWATGYAVTNASGHIALLKPSAPSGTLTAKVVTIAAADTTWDGTSPVGTVIKP